MIPDFLKAPVEFGQSGFAKDIEWRYEDNDLLDPLGIQSLEPQDEAEAAIDASVYLDRDTFKAIIGDAFTQTEIQNDK